MEANSEDKPVLKVATAKKRLVSALVAIGFKPLKGHPLSVVMYLNDETEVILYPGVGRRSGSVLIDPVIALYNAQLQARLSHSGWKGDARVCHAYLGMLDSWGRL